MAEHKGDDVVSVWDENGREVKVTRARSLVLRERGYRATAPSSGDDDKGKKKG